MPIVNITTKRIDVEGTPIIGTPITGTPIGLWRMVGAEFVDLVSGLAVPNSNISNLASPLGGVSVKLDGAVILRAPNSPAFHLSAPFTVQFWINRVSASGRATMLSIGHYTNGLLFRNDGLDDIYLNGVGINTPILFPNGAGWKHVALCCDLSSQYVYVNGALRYASAIKATSINPQGLGVLFGRSAHSMTEYTIGAMDEVLISTGLMYSSNFTPPTKRFDI